MEHERMRGKTDENEKRGEKKKGEKNKTRGKTNWKQVYI